MRRRDEYDFDVESESDMLATTKTKQVRKEKAQRVGPRLPIRGRTGTSVEEPQGGGPRMSAHDTIGEEERVDLMLQELGFECDAATTLAEKRHLVHALRESKQQVKRDAGSQRPGRDQMLPLAKDGKENRGRSVLSAGSSQDDRRRVVHSPATYVASFKAPVDDDILISPASRVPHDRASQEDVAIAQKEVQRKKKPQDSRLPRHYIFSSSDNTLSETEMDVESKCYGKSKCSGEKQEAAPGGQASVVVSDDSDSPVELQPQLKKNRGRTATGAAKKPSSQACRGRVGKHTVTADSSGSVHAASDSGPISKPGSRVEPNAMETIDGILAGDSESDGFDGEENCEPVTLRSRPIHKKPASLGGAKRGVNRRGKLQGKRTTGAKSHAKDQPSMHDFVISGAAPEGPASTREDSMGIRDGPAGPRDGGCAVASLLEREALHCSRDAIDAPNAGTQARPVVRELSDSSVGIFSTHLKANTSDIREGSERTCGGSDKPKQMDGCRMVGRRGAGSAGRARDDEQAGPPRKRERPEHATCYGGSPHEEQSTEEEEEEEEGSPGLFVGEEADAQDEHLTDDSGDTPTLLVDHSTQVSMSTDTQGSEATGGVTEPIEQTGEASMSNWRTRDAVADERIMTGKHPEHTENSDVRGPSPRQSGALIVPRYDIFFGFAVKEGCGSGPRPDAYRPLTNLRREKRLEILSKMRREQRSKRGWTGYPATVAADPDLIQRRRREHDRTCQACMTWDPFSDPILPGPRVEGTLDRLKEDTGKSAVSEYASELDRAVLTRHNLRERARRPPADKLYSIFGDAPKSRSPSPRKMLAPDTQLCDFGEDSEDFLNPPRIVKRRRVAPSSSEPDVVPETQAFEVMDEEEEAFIDRNQNYVASAETKPRGRQATENTEVVGTRERKTRATKSRAAAAISELTYANTGSDSDFSDAFGAHRRAKGSKMVKAKPFKLFESDDDYEPGGLGLFRDSPEPPKKTRNVGGRKKRNQPHCEIAQTGSFERISKRTKQAEEHNDTTVKKPKVQPLDDLDPIPQHLKEHNGDSNDMSSSPVLQSEPSVTRERSPAIQHQAQDRAPWQRQREAERSFLGGITSAVKRVAQGFLPVSPPVAVPAVARNHASRVIRAQSDGEKTGGRGDRGDTRNVSAGEGGYEGESPTILVRDSPEAAVEKNNRTVLTGGQKYPAYPQRSYKDNELISSDEDTQDLDIVGDVFRNENVGREQFSQKNDTHSHGSESGYGEIAMERRGLVTARPPTADVKLTREQLTKAVHETVRRAAGGGEEQAWGRGEQGDRGRQAGIRMVDCPLCGREFSSTDIAIHAGMCGDNEDIPAMRQTRGRLARLPLKAKATVQGRNIHGDGKSRDSGKPDSTDTASTRDEGSADDLPDLIIEDVAPVGPRRERGGRAKERPRLQPDVPDLTANDAAEGVGTCPVCDSVLPLSVLQGHVNACLDNND